MTILGPSKMSARTAEATAPRLQSLTLVGSDDIAALAELRRPLASVRPPEGGPVLAVSGTRPVDFERPMGSWTALSLTCEDGAGPDLSVLVPETLRAVLDPGDGRDVSASSLRVEIALEEVMDTVDAAFGTPMELSAETAERKRDHWRSLQVTTTDDRTHEIWVGADCAALPALVAAARHWPTAPQRCAIRLPIAVRLGAIHLPHARVAALAIGDTILPGPRGIALDRGHLVLCGHVVAPLSLTKDGATLKEDPEMTAEDSIDPGRRADDASNATAPWARTSGLLDDLPVRLDVRLPSRELPLDDVRLLTAGSVIPLEIDAEAIMVELCIGGRTIGRGEIVEIAGRLAVQVLRVSG